MSLKNRPFLGDLNNLGAVVGGWYSRVCDMRFKTTQKRWASNPYKD
jgi:hypothetical protein